MKFRITRHWKIAHIWDRQDQPREWQFRSNLIALSDSREIASKDVWTPFYCRVSTPMPQLVKLQSLISKVHSVRTSVDTRHQLSSDHLLSTPFLCTCSYQTKINLGLLLLLTDIWQFWMSFSKLTSSVSMYIHLCSRRVPICQPRYIFLFVSSRSASVVSQSLSVEMIDIIY